MSRILNILIPLHYQNSVIKYGDGLSEACQCFTNFVRKLSNSAYIQMTNTNSPNSMESTSTADKVSKWTTSTIHKEENILLSISL